MSVWFVLFNLLFLAALLALVWFGRKMEEYGNTPSRGDYISAILFGFSGAVSFATCTVTMNTNPFEGWVDCIVGLAALSVSIWSLTLYRRLRNRY